MKRLFLKASSVAVAATLLKACGGGDSGGGESAPAPAPGPTLAPGPGAPPPPPAPTGSTLLQLVQQDGRFSTLRAAADKAGLSGQIGQAGASQTLFAPTNDAFNALATRIGYGNGGAMVGSLSASQLAGIIGFHVVPQPLRAADLTALGASGGVRPGTLYIFRNDAQQLIFVNDNSQLTIWDGVGRTSITIPETDIAATNGVMHVVSDVLLPRGVLTVSQMIRANIDYFGQFSASMVSAGVVAELDGRGPFTVFAPLDQAVTGALSRDGVRNHVLPQELGAGAFPAVNTPVTASTLTGRGLRLTPRSGSTSNGRTVLATLTTTTSTTTLANVVDVDFYASNGVIHTVDKVLV